MTPEEQLQKWWDKGYNDVYMDDDGKIKSKYAGEVCPCALCGCPTDKTGTKLCDNCWEIKRRLEWIDDLEYAYKVGFILTSRINELMERK